MKFFSGINWIFKRFFKGYKSYIYALVAYPTQAKVLMVSDKNNNWSLPYFCIDERVVPYALETDDFETIHKGIKQELGFSGNLLYYADNYYDKTKSEIHIIYVLEYDGSIEQPKETSWVDLKTLKNLSLKLTKHKSIIQEYLTEIESNKIPELRPAWARFGWFNSVNQWIEQQLLELNYQKLSPVKYIKNWSISCVLRVSTSAGYIYFKQASTLPPFCKEPAVTNELANLFPKNIPTVLSIDSQRHWMLLADFGKPLRKASIKQKKDIYRLLAQIQIKSLEHIDRLLSIGCSDRTLATLSTQIDVLFNDENALSEFNEVKIKQLQKRAIHLKNLCSKLAEYKIPQTLIHGDLHLGNIAFYNNNYIIYDWTDSCISHPFFDMCKLFFSDKKRFFLSPSEYLSQWRIYEPKSRLLEAWKLAKPLCALHYAITYQYIIASLEPRAKQEFEGCIPNFMRQLLQWKI